MNEQAPVTTHLTLIETYPIHEPRETDPHYPAFNRVRDAMEKAGTLVCFIGNQDCGGGPIELHHNIIEFALSTIVDPDHFARLYPQFGISGEEALLEWCESDANLLPLCPNHHRGILGIHTIHYPAWIAQRFLLAGAADPEKAGGVGA